ncbi:MAG TPA: MFS transporter [Thermoanaerobaculia bacterium]|nr:MFS transporter [Thermoanaerobaculia bacterium]
MPGLFNRSFLLLWQGQIVSQLGNQAFLIAGTLFTLEQTGSARMMSAVMAASVIPIVLLAPLGGSFADRYSRRGLLVVTYAARAVAIGGFGLYLLVGPEIGGSMVPVLIAVAFFGGAMSAVFVPTVQAFIPDLVPAARLGAANSLNQLSMQSAVLIGQASGGLLYASLGAAALFLLDALGFAYAAVVTAMLPRDRTAATGRARWSDAIRAYAVEAAEAVRYIRSIRGMAPLILIFTLVNFSFMPVFVLLPLYVRNVLGAGAQWYGFLLAASGAGALAGSLIAAATVARGRRASRLAAPCVAGIAMSVLLLAMTTQRFVAATAFVIVGALASIINVALITAFQQRSRSEMRGRVMALVVVLSTAATPVGMAAGGVMGDLWRDSLPLMFALCGSMLLLIAGATIRIQDETRAE